jgi:AraC-like DNA-binding protein
MQCPVSCACHHSRMRRMKNAARMARVRNFIHADLKRDFSLRELAQVAGLSPTYFAKQFRAEHEISWQEYIGCRRAAIV